MIRRFARRARERIRRADGGCRPDHLSALAQCVEAADDAIRIKRSKAELLRTLIAGQVRKSAVACVLQRDSEVAGRSRRSRELHLRYSPI